MTHSLRIFASRILPIVRPHLQYPTPRAGWWRTDQWSVFPATFVLFRFTWRIPCSIPLCLVVIGQAGSQSRSDMWRFEVGDVGRWTPLRNTRNLTVQKFILARNVFHASQRRGKRDWRYDEPAQCARRAIASLSTHSPRYGFKKCLSSWALERMRGSTGPKKNWTNIYLMKKKNKFLSIPFSVPCHTSTFLSKVTGRSHARSTHNFWQGSYRTCFQIWCDAKLSHLF